MGADPVLISNTRAWLERAAKDLERIDACLSGANADAEDALFHCQQAVKKTLKAFLTWHDRPFRKTHDLELLGQQCAEIDVGLGPLVHRPNSSL